MKLFYDSEFIQACCLTGAFYSVTQDDGTTTLAFMLIFWFERWVNTFKTRNSYD